MKGNSTQLRVWAKVNDHAARLFIDSGCTGNYIFPKFVQKIQVPIKDKEEPYSLRNFDESFMKYNDEQVNQETRPIQLRLGRH